MKCPICGTETRHSIWPKNYSTTGKLEDHDDCQNRECRWQRRTIRETGEVVEETLGQERKERMLDEIARRKHKEFLDSAAKRLGIEVHDGFDLGFLGKKGKKESMIVHAFWGGTEVAVCATSEKMVLAEYHFIAEKCDKDETLERATCRRCLEMLA